jgi:hypothetical protein
LGRQKLTLGLLLVSNIPYFLELEPRQPAPHSSLLQGSASAVTATALITATITTATPPALWLTIIVWGQWHHLTGR